MSTKNDRHQDSDLIHHQTYAIALLYTLSYLSFLFKLSSTPAEVAFHL